VKIDIKDIQRLYIRRAKLNFEDEIEIRRATLKHDLMVKLAIDPVELEKFWNET